MLVNQRVFQGERHPSSQTIWNRTQLSTASIHLPRGSKRYTCLLWKQQQSRSILGQHFLLPAYNDRGNGQDSGSWGTQQEGQNRVSEQLESNQGRSSKQRVVVPWNVQTTLVVTALQFLAFGFSSHVVVPILLDGLGVTREQLNALGLAIVHLALDVLQLAFTIVIFRVALKRHKPRQAGLFKFALNPQLLGAVAVACLTFPVLDGMAYMAQSWFSPEELLQQGTDSMWGTDTAANVLGFILVAVLAPTWEELFFRGFFQVAIMRHMRPWLAVLTSAALFALAHATASRFITLFALGVVIGLAYHHTKNLMVAISVHSLWNVYVLLKLAVMA